MGDKLNRTSLVLLLLMALVAKQGECSCGQSMPGCFPPVVNRAPFAAARASDTCGDLGTETTMLRSPLNGLRICNITTNPPGHFNDNLNTTWWQAPYGIHNVSIQLDFNATVLFSSATLTYRNFPPRAMRLEYSNDGGSTWHSYQYFSYDQETCLTSFGTQARVPDATTGTSVICFHNSTHSSVRRDGHQSEFNPALRLGAARYSNVSLIKDYLVITNLRVQFSRLVLEGLTVSDAQTFSRDSPNANEFFYGVYDWHVAATCHCFGHADSCAMLPGDSPMNPTGCNCSHNTTGSHCEQCSPLYNNRTWLPGTDTEANECQLCECNQHAVSCQYKTGRGVAECNCMHNTRGDNCETCADGYYRNASLPPTDPASCIPCGCNTSYTVSGNISCDGTGQCSCLTGVNGKTCDRCSLQYFNLTVGQGCQSCLCDADGTLPDTTCDLLTGVCRCKSNINDSSPKCDTCVPGYFGPSIFAPEGGCYRCVCSGKTNLCTYLSGYRLHQNRSAFGFSDVDGWTRQPPSLPNQFMAAVLGFNLTTLNFAVVATARTNDFNSFFRAPDFYPELLRTSLGLRFSFELSTRGAALALQLQRDEGDVIITSNHPNVSRIVASLGNITMGVYKQYSFSFTPGQWYVGNLTGRRASLADITAALNHATSLLIAITYFQHLNVFQEKASETYLRNVVLETALTSGTTSLPEARNIESCQCPVEFAGSDCSSCTSPNFTRNYDVRGLAVPSVIDQFDMCTNCSCNAHSSSCHGLTGICSGCAHNTIGDHCETCNDTFYGDATRSVSACMPCQCNSTGSTGAVCNKATGQCPCKPNVEGRRCDRCANGTFNLTSGLGCTACGCNVDAVREDQCHNGTCNCGQSGADMGVCMCKTHVNGTKCTACNFGTQGNVPNCTVCHECFDKWLAIIANVSADVSAESDRVRNTLVETFGTMSPANIMVTLTQVETQLNRSRNLLMQRRQAELTNLLALSEIDILQLNTTLATFIGIIETAEGSLNRSAAQLAAMRIFNGTILIQDGTLISAEYVENATRELDAKIRNATSLFDTEEVMLCQVVANISGVEGRVNTSVNTADASQQLAQVSLTRSSQAAASHTRFEATNLKNEEEVTMLDAAILTLEEDLANASSIVANAANLTSIANTTAYEAQWTAMQQLANAQQLARNASRLASLVATANASASNASGIVASLLASAQNTSTTARGTLQSVTMVNESLAASIRKLRTAEQSAAEAVAVQLPSADTIRALSARINETIVPEAEVNGTLEDARRSLQEAESTLLVAEVAYNLSTLAYQTMSGIEMALAQHSMQQMAAWQALHQATSFAAQTNDSLSRIQTMADMLTERLRTTGERLGAVEAVLPRISACQQQATNNVSSLLDSAQQGCSMLRNTTNQTVSSAEETVSRTQGNATSQQPTAETALTDAERVRSLANDIGMQVADEASIANLTDLLNRYTTLSSQLNRSQTRAEEVEMKIDAAITELEAVATSCPTSGNP